MTTKYAVSSYSAAFESAVAFVLEAEGGYVNDPADAGGETNFGISKKSYPDLNIKALTEDQAKAIYYQDYWLPCRCDEMPAYIAAVVFDTAVNMGQRIGIKFLQQALGVPADGIVGPITLSATYQKSTTHLLPDFLSYRAKRYHELVQQNGQNSRFIRGWLKRTYEIQLRLYEDRLL